MREMDEQMRGLGWRRDYFEDRGIEVSGIGGAVYDMWCKISLIIFLTAVEHSYASFFCGALRPAIWGFEVESGSDNGACQHRLGGDFCDSPPSFVLFFSFSMFVFNSHFAVRQSPAYLHPYTAIGTRTACAP